MRAAWSLLYSSALLSALNLSSWETWSGLAVRLCCCLNQLPSVLAEGSSSVGVLLLLQVLLRVLCLLLLLLLVLLLLQVLLRVLSAVAVGAVASAKNARRRLSRSESLCSGRGVYVVCWTKWCCPTWYCCCCCCYCCCCCRYCCCCIRNLSNLFCLITYKNWTPMSLWWTTTISNWWIWL